MNPRARLGPVFRHFSLSNVCAQSAEQIGLATAPLLAVFLFRADPAQTALLQTAQTLPFLLLAIPAGLLADRLSRRAMLIAAELLRAACFAVILACLFSHALDLPLLAMCGFLGAAGTVAYNVTSPGVVPLLVGKPLFAIANSRLELCRSIAFTAGPSTAGLVYSAWGGGVAYAVALILSLSAASLVAQVRLEASPAKPRDVLSDLREGFRFTFANTHLRPVLLTAVLFNTSWFIMQAAFVPFAAAQLAMGAAEVGTAMAIYGVGMITGALLTPWLSGRCNFGTLIAMGPVGGFLGGLLMLIDTGVRSPQLACASFFCFGAGPVVWAAATATLRQAVTPQPLISRVSSVIMTFTFGARPCGAAIAALIAGAAGSSACIAAAFVGFTAQLAAIMLSNVRRLRTVPDEAATQGIPAQPA